MRGSDRCAKTGNVGKSGCFAPCHGQRLLRNLGADTAAAVVTWTIAILVSYGGAALVATAQAVIFRRLTGWREGVPLS